MTTPTPPTTISTEAREAARREVVEEHERYLYYINVSDKKGIDQGHFVQQLLDAQKRKCYEDTGANLTCGACAEGVFCGSTMHKHDDNCVYTKLATLEQQLSYLRVIARQFSVNIPHSVNRTACQHKALQDYNQWLTLNPETKNT